MKRKEKQEALAVNTMVDACDSCDDYFPATCTSDTPASSSKTRCEFQHPIWTLLTVPTTKRGPKALQNTVRSCSSMTPVHPLSKPNGILNGILLP